MLIQMGRVKAKTTAEAIAKVGHMLSIWLAPVQPWNDGYWWEYTKEIGGEGRDDQGYTQGETAEGIS